MQWGNYSAKSEASEAVLAGMPPTAASTFPLAGIRADESAASPSRASGVVSCAVVARIHGLAWMRRSRLCIAFAIRSLTVAGAAQVDRAGIVPTRAPVSRLTARAGMRARAPDWVAV